MTLLEAYIKLENQRNMSCFNVVEDMQHWVDYGIYTPKQYEHYMLAATYSDTYKDINGIRPRWMDFDSMSIAEIREELESLWAESEDIEREEQEAEEEWEQLQVELKTFKPNNAMAHALTAAKDAAIVEEYEKTEAINEFANNL